ncbi:hypothetical protein CDAR_175371 [Caerostris darwini]|uniref:Uncharacterized protein n=1 Tax=Caerostris darwini TaxID=1538125 RepID=A0AAV4VYP3_9ARAC|nr:hypothetical protein CDAR_175371 [Caerostris darwini]
MPCPAVGQERQPDFPHFCQQPDICSLQLAFSSGLHCLRKQLLLTFLLNAGSDMDEHHFIHSLYSSIQILCITVIRRAPRGGGWQA